MTGPYWVCSCAAVFVIDAEVHGCSLNRAPILGRNGNIAITNRKDDVNCALLDELDGFAHTFGGSWSVSAAPDNLAPAQ
jgi:hypothetical protein